MRNCGRWVWFLLVWGLAGVGGAYGNERGLPAVIDNSNSAANRVNLKGTPLYFVLPDGFKLHRSRLAASNQGRSIYVSRTVANYGERAVDLVDIQKEMKDTPRLKIGRLQSLKVQGRPGLYFEHYSDGCKCMNATLRLYPRGADEKTYYLYAEFKDIEKGRSDFHTLLRSLYFGEINDS